ncbi:MAG TPA: hypothetical protein VMF30_01730 [Pirellulales bacterium]|nr:hypothetical protein [Pirellulales bacterium]
MATVLEIFALLLVLASFFLAYMASKTWRVYQVILAWFVFAASMAMVYLSARTLKTHQAWRSTVQAWEKAIHEVQKENEVIQNGVENGAEIVEPGIDQLRAELHRAVVGRGTVWFKVTADKVDPKTGACTLTIASPVPHDIVTNMVLFAFQQKPVAEGGKYLGEFKVTNGDGKAQTIEIAPILPLTEEDSQRLAQAQGPWTLYAVMPVDDAKLYANMTPEERRALLPGKQAAALEEFAKPDRPLRDYEFFFHQSAIERALLASTIATTQDDLRRIEAAQKKADENVKFREGEITALSADREKFLVEQKAIHTYLEALGKKLVSVQADWKNLLTSTIDTARKIQRIQIRAAEEIDRATNDQANSGPPAPAVD